MALKDGDKLGGKQLGASIGGGRHTVHHDLLNLLGTESEERPLKVVLLQSWG